MPHKSIRVHKSNKHYESERERERDKQKEREREREIYIYIYIEKLSPTLQILLWNGCRNPVKLGLLGLNGLHRLCCHLFALSHRLPLKVSDTQCRKETFPFGRFALVVLSTISWTAGIHCLDGRLSISRQLTSTLLELASHESLLLRAQQAIKAAS